MRSSEEQFEEVMKRAQKKQEESSLKRKMFVEALVGVFCLTVMTAASIRFLQIFVGSGAEAAMQEYGSLLLQSPAFRAVLAALLAFGLGICVTLLFLHGKKLAGLKRR